MGRGSLKRRSGQLGPLEIEDGKALADVELGPIPSRRADCAGGERPCTYVRCRWHTMVDVAGRGDGIIVNYDVDELLDGRDTCALDVADRGGSTLEEVGNALNVTRERIRQIEVKACIRALRAFKRAGITEVPEFYYQAHVLAAAAAEQSEGQIGAAGAVAPPDPVYAQARRASAERRERESRAGARTLSTTLTKEANMGREAKLDLLEGEAASIIERGVEKGVGAVELRRQLVAAGVDEDDLPGDRGIGQYLARRRRAPGKKRPRSAKKPPRASRSRVQAVDPQDPVTESYTLLDPDAPAVEALVPVGTQSSGFLVEPSGAVWVRTIEEAALLSMRIRQGGV